MKSWLDLTESQRKKYIDEFDKKYPVNGYIISIIGITLAGLCLLGGIVNGNITSGIVWGCVICIIFCFIAIADQNKKHKEFIKWLAVSKKVIK